MAKKKAVITEVAGRSIEDWDKQWKLVERGFTDRQHQLRHKVGIWAAKRGDEFMYVAAAANWGDGLAGGLSRVYWKNASGDKGTGIKMIKKGVDELDAYVIGLDRSSENIETAQALQKAMLQRHNPIWNQKEEVVSTARKTAYANK